MYLKKVTLKNFGPHQDFSCDLGPGLIGIVGSNGSGKSTLVNAIYACLTNDFSRFEGRKNGVVNDKAGEEESCFKQCREQAGMTHARLTALNDTHACFVACRCED